MAKNRAISRYKPFFRAGAMDLMAYKFHIFTWLIVTAFQVACTVFLWIAVYKNAGFDSVINGFSFKEMITYMVTVNIMSFVTFDSNSMNVIYDEIRDGTIAVSFIKPISYRLRFVASNLGSFFVKELLFGLPMFIVFMILWFGYKNKKAKYKLASQALASGQAIPRELFQDQSKSEQNKDILSKGIKNAFLGIGLAIMLWCFTENTGVASIGILILCIGLGQIVVAFATRDKNTNNSTDLERL